jgi:hypothetical protein
MKSKIFEFDPVIYPIKLWIIDCLDTKIIKLEFEEFDGSQLNYSLHDHAVCLSYNQMIVRKRTGKYGFLVTIKEINDLTIPQMAHEATHIARFMWDYLGEVNTGIEADAYLVGWIAGCIEKVKNSKT